jgi:tetratricopeptide (TPR) repeat protein
MRTARILCVGLIFSLIIGGCNRTNRDSPSGTSIRTCEHAILAMREKMKNHQATKMDFFTLMNNMSLDPNVQKNDTALGYVCFTYAQYLDEDKQYPKAEEMVKTAIDAAARLHRPPRAIATVHSLLGKIYYEQSKLDSAIMIQKYLIENFRNVDAPNSPSKESFPIWAVQALDIYYPAAKKLDEGIAYLRQVCLRYPGTATSHAALATIFDFQMQQGKKSDALETLELIDRQLKIEPNLSDISRTIMSKWAEHSVSKH